uniref:Uncharacterized protein n=1 Tax=Cajanus cajan TaxID=3821 RepID=A0A151S7W8_CAJCA|nr:hypothetical protein KK1_027274 [Cajanus cajan]
MREKLCSIWKMEGGFKLMDGYCNVNFDLEANREKAVNNVPWMIFDHYLIIRQWSIDFVVIETIIDKTLTWVCFPSIGMIYKSILMSNASAIETPIKIDTNTLNMTQGCFAKVCIQIDLNVLVVGKFNLNGSWYNMEYEDLYILYSHCGCYGHVTKEYKVVSSEPTHDEKKAAWEVAPFGEVVMANPSHANVKSYSNSPIAAHNNRMVVKWKVRKLGTNYLNRFCGDMQHDDNDNDDDNNSNSNNSNNNNNNNNNNHNHNHISQLSGNV